MNPSLLPYHRAALQRSLEEFGLWTRKRLGQHFLYGRKINHRIAQVCRLSRATVVLEIGPGAGHLTAMLARSAGAVHAVEMDERLRPWHECFFAAMPHVHFHYGDFLRYDVAGFIERHAPHPVVIVGNIPYKITAKIVFRLLNTAPRFARMVLTVQKEVAERITSPPGKKSFSFFSVKCQFYTIPRVAFLIPPGEFFPPPRVESATVVFEPREEPPLAEAPAEQACFFRFADAAFRRRRKKLSNSLSGVWPPAPPREVIEAALVELGLPAAARAEQLGVEDFVRLYQRLRNG
ncbi:MAG: 16S rRNA (adenine(1518)-N(6)/adenine(1519)-N(6)) -dimethyltransferase RsmA [Candidatus Sumerlaeia bacterium]